MSSKVWASQMPLITIMYEALSQPIGLIVQAAPGPQEALAKFYASRKAALDPRLDELQFVLWSGPEGNLAIVKRHITRRDPSEGEQERLAQARLAFAQL